MRIAFSGPFKKDYEELPSDIKQAFEKAIKFLLENFRHPSLRAKKLPGTSIWYIRITRSYRLTFQFENNIIILRRIGTHDILDEEHG